MGRPTKKSSSSGFRDSPVNIDPFADTVWAYRRNSLQTFLPEPNPAKVVK
jgi:hypothetical protein